MSALKIRSKAMLGTTHSWAVTIRALLNQFELMGHELYLESINGHDLFPQRWEKYKRAAQAADIDLTYTLPRNFGQRFNNNSKLKLAIYNYESSILPKVWEDKIAHVDYVLPSSAFSKEVFVNAGWPEEKCLVIPHGINLKDFEDKSLVGDLKTKKKFKFLNVSIPHYRKNIDVLVDAYYSAFNDNDEVCLLIKTRLKKPKYKFECDIVEQILKAQKKHAGRRLPQIEVVQTKYDSLVPLYNTCDCLVSASSAEGFGLPLLEALAAGLIVIAPRYSGQLDFLNDTNSILVDVKMMDAGDRYQYWRATPGAVTSLPEVEALAVSMRRAYEDHVSLQALFKNGAEKTVQRFTWENAARQILEIA